MGILAGFMVPHPPLAIPEIGRGQERKIQKTIDAYHQIGQRIKELQPETIVLLSPHQVMYADYFHISPGTGASGDFRQFGARQVAVEAAYEKAFVKRLCSLASKAHFPAGTKGEQVPYFDHGTMVPLYFVNQYWINYRLVRIGLSGLSFLNHYELGMMIQKTAKDLEQKTVVIASGDLSHYLTEDGPYGFREEGPVYDETIIKLMGKGDFGQVLECPEALCQKAGECGHGSFLILAGALDRLRVKSQMLSYEGPFGVGYGICVYEVEGREESRNFGEQHEQKARQIAAKQKETEDAYVSLARKSIEEYVRTGNVMKIPGELPEEMYEQRAGVFVSIEEDNRLRGCIGTIQPSKACVAEEILFNAISAAVHDPRFTPIETEELDRLIIHVDVLGKAERIASEGMLDVKRYGVIVTKGDRRGLLLPDLEGIATIEDQIAIAKEKAGIKKEEQVQLERFEVVRHK